MSTSWKQLVIEAESITKANGKAAWRTAQILRELFANEDFRAEGCSNKLDEVEKKLAKFSGRFALGVNDMIQMIEHFPAAKDWENGRLDILRDKTCRILAKKQHHAASEKKSPQRITISMYEALQEKLRAVRAENKRLKAEIEELRKGRGGQSKTG